MTSISFQGATRNIGIGLAVVGVLTYLMVTASWIYLFWAATCGDMCFVNWPWHSR